MAITEEDSVLNVPGRVLSYFLFFYRFQIVFFLRRFRYLKVPLLPGFCQWPEKDPWCGMAGTARVILSA